MAKQNFIELRHLYLKLYKEFLDGKASLEIVNSRYNYIFRETLVPNSNPSCNRYQEGFGYGSSTIRFFDSFFFNQSIIGKIIKESPYSKLFHFFKDSGLSIFKDYDIEQDKSSMPSITNNLIAGFITRIFDLIYNDSIEQDIAFNQAFDELIKFLTNDTFSIRTLVSLYGPVGDVDVIPLNDNASVKKADYKIVQYFSRLYNDLSLYHTEILENDFYIDISSEILKKDFMSYPSIINKEVKKIFKTIALSFNGNVELGKIIYLSDAWPVATIRKGSAPSINHSKYNHSFKFICFFSQSKVERVVENWNLINNVNFDSLDPHIISSIKRVIKAKASFDIEDRIVELVLAIEYLINTSPNEVTLQLCLKIMNILDRKSGLENLYKQLKEFFVLRGHIFHGNQPVKDSEKSIKLLLDIESIVNQLILQFIKLSKEHKFKVINEELSKSLYLRQSVQNLLEKGSDIKKNAP